MQKKPFVQNNKVNFKNHDITTWLRTILIHTLTNFSRSKGNKAIEFGQLIEYNIEHIFL